MSEPANPELKSAIVEVIKQVTSTVEQGKEFVVKEAPLLVKELIAWKRVALPVETFIWFALFVFGICLVLNYFRLRKKGLQMADAPDYSRSEQAFNDVKATGSIWTGIFMTLITGILTLCTFFTALQVWLAPRVYVLNYFKDML